MKRFRLCALSLVICSLFTMPCSLRAITYCANSSWGYAGTSVTGGGSATPTLVANESQLTSALGKGNCVIIITQNITVTNHISSDKSNMTIMALPGVKLISEQQNQANSGILYLKGSNLILRNLTFEGPGAYDCDGWDNLCLDKAKNVWVDHCDFQDGCDGNFDIKSKSDNITVTWCRFRYLKSPKAGGSGGSDDHRFSNLVGSSSSDKPDDGTYNITYGYCWWDQGCKQRMTRCRNALIHYLNCYWNSSVADYYVGPENVSSYFEGCTFEGKANSASKIWSPFNGTTNYCNFVNCSGNLPSNAGSVSAPAYAYDQLTPAAAKTYVTNSSCGAGATLTVTTAAEVSSSCDSDEPVDPTPEDQPVEPTDIVETDTWWNISDAEFNALGTITSATAVRQLHILATSDASVIVDGNNKSIDGYSFTSRLKLGGAGSQEARHLWLDVKGDCTIDLYAISSNNSDSRTLNIATGYFKHVTSQQTVGTSVAKISYNYTGSAARIYLYSAAGGINLYGIRLTYSATPTDVVPASQTDGSTQKILRNNQIFILRGDHTYTLTGQKIK